MEEERILSIDGASKKTGYAIYENGKIVQSGTWNLKTYWKKDLYKRITKTIEEHDITIMVVEDIYEPRMSKYEKETASDSRIREIEGKKHAFHILSQCRGIMELVAEQTETYFKAMSPIKVKQHMWGMRYGHKYTRDEQKERMIRKVNALGYKLEKDNADDEADAIGILITYLERNNFPVQHPNR